MEKFFTEQAQRHWHKPTGLVFSVIASLLIITFLLKSTQSDQLTFIIAYIICSFFIILIWYQSNRYPKTQKGKVGFIVSIQCSDDEEHKRIREDFILTLRKLLKVGSLGKTFHFIEIPKHLSKKINEIDDAILLRAKTKGHFVIYGRVRLRSIGGKECHILDLEGIVGHKPLPKEISARISREFSELFPRSVHIAKENDLLAFNFTSDWTECVAKYIIAIAASYSQDLNYAESLYTELLARLNTVDNTFPIFIKLKQRIPKRLSEIYETKAIIIIDFWRKNHEERYLKELSNYVHKIGEDRSNEYGVLLLKSIEAFLNGRDVKKALMYAKKCKKFNDPIWHFNIAFLKAYEGFLGVAIREYRHSTSYEISAQTISQVEDFMCWILEEEPDKFQFHYCLGFFNWKIKGDYKQALHDFESFLESGDLNTFERERELAKKWIEEINNILYK